MNKQLKIKQATTMPGSSPSPTPAPWTGVLNILECPEDAGPNCTRICGQSWMDANTDGTKLCPTGENSECANAGGTCWSIQNYTATPLFCKANWPIFNECKHYESTD
jgi:hypothetical protein